MYVFCQENAQKKEEEVETGDPLDVDARKVSENLNNASEQPSTPYGAIPNGTANTDGKTPVTHSRTQYTIRGHT